ncbi:hypothetical protein E3N88_22908 [Mikania micrantha]|uniref:Protein kinase domain-containing protein n=1 Tax=Mikania micrantha TaxID=192012 RepID=A0A5N6NDG9_9ASTR|nr:hypothetical protein E3N88_22908 [Mikania micrantha]
MSPKCLKEYAILAERCLHNSPKHRPTMAEVLFSLESVLAIQEKFNNSLQSASKTTFGRVVNLHNSPKHRPTMAEVLPSLEPVQVEVAKVDGDELVRSTTGGGDGGRVGDGKRRNFYDMVQTWRNSGNNIGSSSSDLVVATKLESLKADIAALKARDSSDLEHPTHLGQALKLLCHSNRQAWFCSQSNNACRIIVKIPVDGVGAILSQDDHPVAYFSKGFSSSNRIKSELAPSTSSAQPSVSCHHFEFPEILIATENFSESLVIVSGGFGKVYKGNIINGSNVVVAAIKHLDSMSNQGAADLWAEVEMLSMLSRVSLPAHWHRDCIRSCIAMSRALIVLPESWASKISDFGLSKIDLDEEQWDLVTWVQYFIKEGNIQDIIDSDMRGEISPKCLKEYVILAERCLHNSPKHRPIMAEAEVNFLGHMDHPNIIRLLGHLTTKCDIYSFGVVLLVSIAGQKAMDVHRPEGQQRLVEWATHIGSNIKKIMDPCLEDADNVVDVSVELGIGESWLE